MVVTVVAVCVRVVVAVVMGWCGAPLSAPPFLPPHRPSSPPHLHTASIRRARNPHSDVRLRSSLRASIAACACRMCNRWRHPCPIPHQAASFPCRAQALAFSPAPCRSPRTRWKKAASALCSSLMTTQTTMPMRRMWWRAVWCGDWWLC